MTNNEPIEQWRAEFIDQVKKEFPSPPSKWFRLDEIGEFEDTASFLRFEGFKSCKRSQPVIELPSQINCEGVYFDMSGFDADETKEAITAAGYQYRIKE